MLVVHGYSLLRTQLNNDYFHDLFDESAKFGIEIEGHRTSFISVTNRLKNRITETVNVCHRHRDGPRRL